jgi:hypothetical protein
MRFATLILVLVLVLAPAAVRAEQYVTADGHVIHTRLAPVIAHKVVPPYRGVHVYQGRPVRR